MAVGTGGAGVRAGEREAGGIVIDPARFPPARLTVAVGARAGLHRALVRIGVTARAGGREAEECPTRIELGLAPPHRRSDPLRGMALAAGDPGVRALEPPAGPLVIEPVPPLGEVDELELLAVVFGVTPLAAREGGIGVQAAIARDAIGQRAMTAA